MGILVYAVTCGQRSPPPNPHRRSISDTAYIFTSTRSVTGTMRRIPWDIDPSCRGAERPWITFCEDKYGDTRRSQRSRKRNQGSNYSGDKSSSISRSWAQRFEGAFIDVANGAEAWLITSLRSPRTNGTNSLSHGTRKPVRNEIRYRPASAELCRSWHTRDATLTLHRSAYPPQAHT